MIQDRQRPVAPNSRPTAAVLLHRNALATRTAIGDESEGDISGGAICMDLGLTGKVALVTRAREVRTS